MSMPCPAAALALGFDRRLEPEQVSGFDFDQVLDQQGWRWASLGPSDQYTPRRRGSPISPPFGPRQQTEQVLLYEGQSAPEGRVRTSGYRSSFFGRRRGRRRLSNDRTVAQATWRGLM